MQTAFLYDASRPRCDVISMAIKRR